MAALFISRLPSSKMSHRSFVLGDGLRQGRSLGEMSSLDSTLFRKLAFFRPNRTQFRKNVTAVPSASGDVNSSEELEEFESDYVVWKRGGGLVSMQAHVHSSAIVQTAAVVHRGAKVSHSCHIDSGSVVGRDVVIGHSTRLGPNVNLQNCSIGNECILHSGVSIGQDGFGFFVNERGEMVKKPQMLRVVIGNNVEIGANSCVDRGSWRDTKIGDGCKLDNLVQIGHNVELGRFCILCGQVGIGGSCTVGDYVVFGGQSGAADHVTIAAKIRVAAKSGVIHDLTTAGDYAGFPAVPASQWRRTTVIQRRQGRGEPAAS